jgi:ectoine hydroxylase-related dioxygenase (phytanoyl-CoA dioxygenase family)
MTTLSAPPLELSSNGFPLANGPHRIGRLTPTKATETINTIREIYRAQGYVWLQGFFDRETILEFHRHFFTAFRDAGLLQTGTKPEEGIFSGQDDKRVTNKILMEVVRSAAYESFCLQAKLWQFYDAFLQGPSYLHKRKIIRYMNPGDTATTPAHYDLIYLRAGTDKVCSSWIPLGDTPVEMGGLVYLENSDTLGRKMEAEFSLQNADLSPAERISAYNKNMTEGGWVGKDLADMAERFDSRWLIADYEAGDMVVHSPYMIHAATQNVDPQGRIRLSTDIRYQNVRDEIDARWQNHWSLEDML